MTRGHRNRIRRRRLGRRWNPRASRQVLDDIAAFGVSEALDLRSGMLAPRHER